jgi:hypothetical protein
MPNNGRSRMASSKRDDLGAVWLVQSRKLLSQLEFWLILVGYDRRSHSFSSRIYMVYLFIFFSLWGFAVLVLLAGVAGQFLSVLPFSSPLQAAVAMGVIAFIAIFLLELYFAARSSPFVFSEPDSYLLCLTPVDRRIVATIWLLGAWVGRGLLVWPGSVVLGYAVLEAQSPRGLTIADLPAYLLAGVRMLLVALPMHLTVQSLAWSVGAWRLQGKRDEPILRWLAPIMAVLLVAGWILAGSGRGVNLPVWLWPVDYPVRAGIGVVSWLAGFGLSLVWAALGLWALWSASQSMSLARAAQESRSREAMQAAILTGSFDLAEEMRQQRRLGAGRRPSRLPARPGISALLWRNTVQEQRSFTLSQVFPWLVIFSLTLGMWLVADWGARAWFFVLWVLIVGQQVARHLGRDLSRWWLLRQLPFASGKVVLVDLILPLTGIALTGGGAFVLAWLAGQPVAPIVGWLFLPGAAAVAMVAATDILRQCKSERLPAGQAPGPSFLLIVLAGLVLFLLGGMTWLIVIRLSLSLWIAIPVMLLLFMGVDYGLYRLSGSLLRNIRS